MQRNPKLVGADRQAVADELADLYRAGSSIRGLAARTGRSYGAVHRLLAEAGVRFRPRSSPRIRSN
ncbi:helix-turn-helix domain-containing protein [Streptomyces sp. NPDC007148]|uniref:helix-turn-helix domain-containing protein n=1 Tax=Streptomyces sp. NPDC007148 TaxID=3364775 RepID=UPI00368762A8